MKVKHLIILLITYSGIGFSQINVGQMSYGQSDQSGDLPDEIVEQFRKTTTVFVLQEKEKARIEEYKTVLSTGWYFNEFEVINQSDYPTYAEKIGKYSFISIVATVSERDNLRRGYFFLKYTLPYLKKGNKKREHTLSFISLFPDAESLSLLSKTSFLDKGVEDTLFKASQNSIFYNYSPAHLKTYLSFMSQSLNRKTPRYIDEKSVDEGLLKKLAKDTLFIPSYTYLKNYYRKEIPTTESEKALMQNYAFPYKVLSKEEFEKKVIDAPGTLYVLDYLLIQGMKTITVIEARSGLIVYAINDASIRAAKINAKDFEALSKKMSSALKD